MSTHNIIQNIQNSRKVRERIFEAPSYGLPAFLQDKSDEEPEQTTEEISNIDDENIWEKADEKGEDAPQEFKNLVVSKVKEIKEGGKIDELVDGSDTPLTISISSNLPYLFEAVMKLGANPNTPNKHGEYPISLSARVGNFQMTEALVSSGAKLNQKDSNGYNIILIALDEKDPVYLDEICSAYPNLVRDTYLSPQFDDAKELSKWEISYKDKAGNPQSMKAYRYIELVVGAVKEEFEEKLESLKGKELSKNELMAVIREWYTGESLDKFKADLSQKALKLVRKDESTWAIVPSHEVKSKETKHEPTTHKPETKPIDLGDEDAEPVEISVEVPIEPEETEEPAKPKEKSKAEELTVSDEEIAAYVEEMDDFKIGTVGTPLEWAMLINQLFPGTTRDEKMGEFKKAMETAGKKLVRIPGNKNKELKVIQIKKDNTKKLPFRFIGK